MIKIQIPATSANLGAGFDSLGLAVNLYNGISVCEWDTINISSSDNTFVPKNEKNLVYKSAKTMFDICGKRLDGLKIVQANAIPMTRGLGSSSACIIGGLLAANKILNNPLSTDDLVNLASSIEGHPDNTTPALIGGIVTSVLDNDKVYWVKQEVSNNLKFVAIVPDFPLKTSLARECLPKRVSHVDARFNLSRAALFSASLLQGKYENIRIAVEDKLHQPHRMPLIKNSKEVFQKAYEHDAYGVYISGAGPTIMAIVDGSNKSFVSNMKLDLVNLGLENWLIYDLEIENYGAKIIV